MAAKLKQISIADDLEALFTDAALMYGEAVPAAMLAIFGGGAKDVWSVPFDLATDCFARLARLADPTMAPLPPHVPAPVRANNPLQAKLARQDFEIAALKRKDKAAALFPVLHARTHAPHLKNFVMDAVWDDERRFCGFRASGETPSIRPVYLCASWGIPVFLACGITLATVGTFQRPCIQGLKGLETLLKMVPKIAGPDRGLLTNPPPSPDEIYDRERAAVESKYERDGDYKAYCAAIDECNARYRRSPR